ncbi:glycosyl hydrolase family 16 [Coprinopsis cinerea okayama7|uniref:Glycosyl hydrolase family 16 n=1 Tax=Coprinopsis cinerea (strain Okayama-7 / 130 / ATCC MYA-4618 / FGSC 9003) TaxID=240176 RepID=A8NVR5_COPC7|nr:glycosyl hydrolase family 16 [Coprinopsis cinerea okayama7\|eukprot:XP_001836738.2 glycosyl hydrolase family 16 [Coprinopsis cinerea okayama7\
MKSLTSLLLLALLQPLVNLLPAVQAAPYSIAENIVGEGFYSAFDWQAISDPTHGRVRYVDQGTSLNLNLTYASGNRFILRTDSRSLLSPSGPGRNSVRIQSKRAYTRHVAVTSFFVAFPLPHSTRTRFTIYPTFLHARWYIHMYILPPGRSPSTSPASPLPFSSSVVDARAYPGFDVHHMPQGCGTWPAIWETAVSNWPYGGEVDIVEGVNDQAPNAATLHTGPGCSMPSSGRPMTGTAGQLDCNAFINSNAGCGVKFPSSNSYGPEFNRNGGGWYAMERTDAFIKVWFWPRNSGSVPEDVRHGRGQINTDSWGTPTAYFPNTQCDITRHFSANNIIINITLCGDWAGNVFSQSGCPGTCVDYVNNNPGAFEKAFFDMGAVRIYV